MKRKDFPATKVVEVEWEDSASTYGWMLPSDYSETPIVCRSIGYALDDEEGECLRLVQSVSESGRVSELITIPRTCILKLKVLRGGLA